MFMFLCFLDLARIFWVARFGRKTDGQIYFQSMFFKYFMHLALPISLLKFLTIPSNIVPQLKASTLMLLINKQIDMTPQTNNT